MNLHEIHRFMKESYEIEDERFIPTKDKDEAVSIFLSNPLTEESIKKIHFELFKGLFLSIIINPGEYRKFNVRVGKYIAPEWEKVPELMRAFVGFLFAENVLPCFKRWNAFDLYQEFEHIHPFQDGNGRGGRLLWLHKAIKEGYDFRLSFLEKFHYQSLENYR